MTAKFSASADGTKVYLGNASENALEIDATGKTIKPVAPYSLQNTPQSWQDVTSSRNWGSTYTNSTKQPITVKILLQSVAGTNLASNASVGAQGVANLFFPGSLNVVAAFDYMFVVPPGATYTVTTTGAATANWLELRN